MCSHGQGSCFGFFFAHFCVSLLFWGSSISWEPFKCFALFFYRFSWYYSGGYLNKGTFLQQLALCWQPFWGISGLILEHAPLFLRTFPHLTLWNFVQMFLIWFLQCVKYHFLYCSYNVLRKNLTVRVPLLGHYADYFGYIPQYFKKLKTFSWYFARMSWDYCDGH